MVYLIFIATKICSYNITDKYINLGPLTSNELFEKKKYKKSDPTLI